MQCKRIRWADAFHLFECAHFGALAEPDMRCAEIRHHAKPPLLHGLWRRHLSLKRVETANRQKQKQSFCPQEFSPPGCRCRVKTHIRVNLERKIVKFPQTNIKVSESAA